jgi:hypothetical protein
MPAVQTANNLGTGRLASSSLTAQWQGLVQTRGAERSRAQIVSRCRHIEGAAPFAEDSGAAMTGAKTGQACPTAHIELRLARGKARAAARRAERKAAALEHPETLLEMFATARGLRNAWKRLAANVRRAGAAQGAGARHGLVPLACAAGPKLVQLLDAVPSKGAS